MSISSTEIDRLALRIGALRSARRRRSIRDGAWAAGRLRLDGIVLDRSDARFAHDAVVRFGHALRIARVRRPWRGQTDEALASEAPKRSWLWRAIATALVVATVALILFIAQPQTGQDNVSGAVAGGGGGVPAASPLRGRSDGVRVAVLVTAASPGPAPTGEFEREDRINTGGAGATGAGSTGSGGGTPARTAAPTPAPNVMRLSGRVVDSRTGNGLPGVCIVIGATNCARSPITDELGIWTVDLNLGQVLSWNIKFVKTDYVQKEINVPSRPGTFTVETVSLLSFH